MPRKKKTHEEFMKEVFNLVGDEYKVVGVYKSTKEKVKLKHENCNYSWDIFPSSFLQGSRCPNCAGTIKRTHEEFVSEIVSGLGDVYEFLTEFKTTRLPIKIMHKKCKHVWDIRANDLLRGVREKRIICPNCNIRRSITTEEFKDKVFELVGNEYIVLEDHRENDIDHKIKIKHNTQNCSHEYYVRPFNFIGGSRCQQCYFSSRRKTHEQFIKEVYSLVGSEYTILSKYQNSKIKIEIQHVCGNTFSMKPSDFLHGERCPKCSQVQGKIKNTKTHEYFIKEVIQIHGDVYDFITQYKGSKRKIIVRHKECEHVWDADPITFLRKRYFEEGSVYCPKCSYMSKGERKISNLLESWNLNFKTQMSFDNCRKDDIFRFDFAVFNNNNELKYLIEYDGEQHFEPVDFAGKGIEWALEEFNKIKERDQIKNEYCKINNINLYRIPYWHFENIEDILTKLLHNEQLDIDENLLVKL